MLKFFLFLIIPLILFPTPSFARVTPNDIYQQRQEDYQNNLNKISDPNKKKLVEDANQQLKDVNHKICDRFDSDVAKMAAILEEEKRRQNITRTTVAYGQGNTPLDSAAYWLNYAAEAVAYQKSQDYTPNLSGNLKNGLINSENNLNNDLGMLRNKILKAKTEVGIAINHYEK